MIKTSLLYWWPKVKDLGIPVPRTEIWEADLKSWFDAMEGGRFSPDLVGFLEEAQSVARLIGYPLFLRTDLASGKHGWKRTCFVQEESALGEHIYRVLEENEIAGIVGLDYRALAFREMLDLKSHFVAFRGDLPIAKERRYFVRDGEVVCHHPYWAEDAIRSPSRGDWRILLANLNHELPSEVELLTSYSKKIGSVLAGHWSVDYAKTVDGTWYLIDMAEGSKSWHDQSCKYADKG